MMDSLPSLSLIGKLWYQKSENRTFKIFLVWTDGFSCNSWWGICWILAGTSRHSWWGTRYDFIFITINIFEVFFLPGSILKHTKAYISSTNLTSSLCSSSNISSDYSYTTTSSPPLLPSGFDLSLTSTVNHPWTSKSQFRPWNNIFFLLYRNYLRPNSDAYFAFKTTSYKAGAKMRLRASQQNFFKNFNPRFLPLSLKGWGWWPISTLPDLLIQPRQLRRGRSLRSKV